jgi:hypothetical protein
MSRTMRCTPLRHFSKCIDTVNENSKYRAWSKVVDIKLPEWGWRISDQAKMPTHKMDL